MSHELDEMTGARRPTERDLLLSRLLSGAAAGFMATVPMSVVMKAVQLLLPWWQHYALPPSRITKRVARRLGLEEYVDDRREHLVLTLAAHFGYGSAAGSLYPLLTHKIPLPPLLKGMGYGLLVWLGGYMGWLPAMRILPSVIERPVGRNILNITAHLTWGGVVGILTNRRE